MREPINPKLVDEIENLVVSMKKDGYMFKRYGDNPIAAIVGETHFETGEQLELQNTIIRMLKPGCVITERFGEQVKSQIMQIDRTIAEKAHFVDFIGSSEEKQGNIILENGSHEYTGSIIGLIGHLHAGTESKIHKILEEKIGYICVWNQEEVKKVMERQLLNEQ
ncbi:MAG: hypothetical protein IBX39_09795 [Candidatus Methanoperedenaceae archaeon]|nr:hypothetical protein [Candidatus Methanoperedenaceae archaeon]